MKKSTFRAAAFAALFAAPAFAATVHLAGDSVLMRRPPKPEDPKETCLGSWGEELRRNLGRGVSLRNASGDFADADAFCASTNAAELLASARKGDIAIISFGGCRGGENLAHLARALRARGAEPVFATPVAKLGEKSGGAPCAVRKAAEEAGAALIDLNAATRALAEKEGAEEALSWYRAVEDDRDFVHPTRKGSRIFARAFLRELQEAGGPAAAMFRPVMKPAHLAAGIAGAACAGEVRAAEQCEAESKHFSVRSTQFAAKAKLETLDGKPAEESRRLVFTFDPERKDSAGRAETGRFAVEFRGLAEGEFAVYPLVAGGKRGARLNLRQNRRLEIDTSMQSAGAQKSFEIEIRPWPTAKTIAVKSGAGTLEAALEEVAKIRKSDTATPLRLVLEPGEYPLRKGLRVTRDHARAGWGALEIVAADADRKPMLIGGTPVGPWRKEGFRGRSDVWTADVAGLGIPANNRLFFHDGAKMEAARWPNVDRAKPYTTGYAFAAGKPTPAKGPRYQAVGLWENEIIMAPGDVRKWSDPSEGWVVVFPRHNWWNRSYAISNVTEKGVIELRKAKKEIDDRLFIWDRWCAMGIGEELDAPGEWYHERKAGKIHFIPPDGKDPNAGRSAVALSGCIVHVAPETANVAFESLEIACGNAGVIVDNADDVQVRGCLIHDVGFISGNGVSARGRRIRVEDCDVWNTGSYGIALHGPWGENGWTDRCGNAAANNYVHHTGQFDSHGCGIIIGGHGVTVRNNYVHDVPRCGLYGYGRFSDISYNRVRHVNTTNDDTGAIYGGGWTGGLGTTVRYTHFSDSIGFQRQADGKYRLYKGACGIYPDEGCGGLIVYGNLVENCHHAAMHLHNGRWITISNNVFVSNGSLPAGKGTLQLSLQSWNNHPEGYFMKVRRKDIARDVHGVIAEDHRFLRAPSFRQQPDRDDRCFNEDGTTMMGVQVRNNIFHYPDQGEGVALRSWTKIRKDENPFDNNLYWGGCPTNVWQQSGARLDWTQWRATGQDANSKIGDPLFRDAAKGDYRLKPESPAFALGFRELPYAKMGLQLSRLRKKLPKDAEGLREHPEWLEAE